MQQALPERPLRLKPVVAPELSAHNKTPNPVSSSRKVIHRDVNREWATHMPTIKRLYIDEERPLREVMEIMSRDYGFNRM